jgi:hypothetical protein
MKVKDITKLMEYVDSSATFRIVLALVNKFWLGIIIIVLVVALTAKKDDKFIDISKIKGFIKK